MSTDDPLSPARGLERSIRAHHSQPLSQGRPPLVGSSAHMRRKKQQSARSPPNAEPPHRCAEMSRTQLTGSPSARERRSSARERRGIRAVYGMIAIAADRNSRAVLRRQSTFPPSVCVTANGSRPAEWACTREISRSSPLVLGVCTHSLVMWWVGCMYDVRVCARRVEFLI